MLDIKVVRQDPQAVADALKKRGFEFDVAGFVALDARRKQADVESQNLLAERKAASKQIGALIGQGMSVDDAKAQVNETLEKIAAQIDDLTGEAKQVQAELEDLLLAVPNIPADEVPEGASEDDNVEVASWGEPTALAFEAKDHVELGEALGEMDFETAGKITGSRFNVMYGNVARMHRALIQFMLNLHTGEHGYSEIYVPYIVNRDSLRGTGQLPKFEEDLFKLETDQGYYLIPTAEVPVTNVGRDRIFDDAELGEQGVKFACHTPCFRSEAGSYGRDTRGIIRQHQFEKVELVQFVRPTQSDDALEQLTGHAEKVLQRLNLPYRKVILCGGDIGFSARKTYDLEVWLPAQNTYREISSCSNFGDYQARRMQARWRNPETGKPELLHTLNGSGLAVGRTLVAIMENYQRDDGSIEVPEALRPYMGGAEVLSA
ncbi:serine--tRNA ligase [Halioglobus japonicus]|uniref:Serine--tRNA ligase n=1 Tax=Halioglobus japonicus TaxID=930805 RepID=A0AAP8SQ11_9GAMM|nr:serine--tRNA ligase [Halioglobus japonicus]AQA18909.1 serine--tRNA ligase [Halioglobus japonicus]PLW88079.1 serine--tRNA ligase [Halioglobus japonicus]GHD20717.1 serine--tRNA ligase [Halioglobus japonicus]